MVLRNVPSTATFEEQRVEINELAVDVDTLASNPDTLQTVTDRGFTTDNPIKIENYAATAFVVEDGSSNEKFVVDSVNGKINVGSSAGGASGIYLFHNNSGATPAITLDGATGSITNKGQLVTESILSSAALNNKGSIQFGTVDAYSIGHMPLNSNLAFSQTHGGSYLFYSDASTVELEIASGGVKVDGILESSLLVNTNNTPTAGEGIEMFYDSAASGGAAGAIQSFDRDSNALTRLKIRSSNWEIDNDGSAAFNGNVIAASSSGSGGTNGNSQLGTYNSSNSYLGLYNTNATKVAGNPTFFIYDRTNSAYKARIWQDGSATFDGAIVHGQLTAGGTGGNYLSNGEVAAYGPTSSANIWRGWDVSGSSNVLTSSISAAGAAAFEQGLSVGYGTSSGSTVITRWRSDVVSANSTVASVNADGSAAFRSTIASGAADRRGQFLGTCPSSVTASAADAFVANYDSTTVLQVKYDGSAAFGAASNSTGNNGVLVGGNNGSLNIYTDRYTTDCFQIVNTTGSGTNVALKAYGNGDVEIAGIIQTNTKSAGHIELDSTGAFTSPKLKLFSNTGDITTAGALTFTGQTSTAASGSGTSSDAFDHYEEGSWTPTPLGLSNSPTYSNLKGRFVRIGSLVQINGFIQMASSPTWNNVNDFFMLGPLPFNYNADNAGYFATAGSVTCQNFNFHDNDYNNTGQVNCGIANSSGVSYICFLVSDNNNTRGVVKNSAVSGNDIIEFSLTYRAG